MKDNPPSLDDVRNAMKPAVRSLQEFDGLVRIVTHYDADGITAAGIMVKPLLGIGKRFRLSFVKGVDIFYGLMDKYIVPCNTVFSKVCLRAFGINV